MPTSLESPDSSTAIARELEATERAPLVSETAASAPVKNGFERQTFTTSNLLDYFSQKELALQTGHDREHWPDVLLKELVDNALDAAEHAGVKPEITVSVEGDSLSVADNGPGLAPEIVTRILDFSTRTSSKNHYVSPTRGAQGNAFKTLLAIPYVLSECSSGTVEIKSRGVRHFITVGVDRIRQQPKIEHQTESCDVKKGCIVKIMLPELASLQGDSGGTDFLQQVMSYSLLNTHAEFAFRNGRELRQPPRDPAWEKWRPSDPTSPHWYSVEQFRSLIAACISAEQVGGPVRYVRDFVRMFRGLSGTARQKVVLESTGLAGARLHDLVRAGEVDRELATKLLDAMREQSREVKPMALGVIGEANVRQNLELAGCVPVTIGYKRAVGLDEDHRPYVIETAFGLFKDQEDMKLITGLNFSPCIVNPFRDLGGHYGSSLDSVLGEQFICKETPALVLVHLAAPYLRFADRGKSTVALPAIVGEAIKGAVEVVTREYARLKKREIRRENAEERTHEKMLKASNGKRDVKEIVWEHMTPVYAEVSGNGTLPAYVRQLMYVLRSIVLAEIPEGFTDGYFTQTLLPMYLREHEHETADWDVVYDDRGHLTEPHTGSTIGLGTLAVRKYLAESKDEHGAAEIETPSIATDFETHGPANRFNNILFVEKEGFLPILQSLHIGERFDLAIMSSKGLGSTSARELMEGLTGVRILVLHDFDKSGFSIIGTLSRDTVRYRFERPPVVIDLGLRIEDVKREGLKGEPVTLRGESPEDNLQLNGATGEEIAYLTGNGTGRGQRVELNALTSPQFIAFLERKLKQHGVRKIVPGKAVLLDANRRAYFAHGVNAEIEKIVGKLKAQAEKVKVPTDLAKRVQARLKQDPALSWDAVVSQLAGDHIEGSAL